MSSTNCFPLFAYGIDETPKTVTQLRWIRDITTGSESFWDEFEDDEVRDRFIDDVEQAINHFRIRLLEYGNVNDMPNLMLTVSEADSYYADETEVSVGEMREILTKLPEWDERLRGFCEAVSLTYSQPKWYLATINY